VAQEAAPEAGGREAEPLAGGVCSPSCVYTAEMKTPRRSAPKLRDKAKQWQGGTPAHKLDPPPQLSPRPGYHHPWAAKPLYPQCRGSSSFPREPSVTPISGKRQKLPQRDGGSDLFSRSG